jgi:hypothetical protein
METVEALEIKGRPYRYRATIRWGSSSRYPLPLCNCKQGHASKEEALKCKKAQEAMPEYLREEEELGELGETVDRGKMILGVPVIELVGAFEHVELRKFGRGIECSPDAFRAHVDSDKYISN